MGPFLCDILGLKKMAEVVDWRNTKSCTSTTFMEICHHGLQAGEMKWNKDTTKWNEWGQDKSHMTTSTIGRQVLQRFFSMLHSTLKTWSLNNGNYCRCDPCAYCWWFWTWPSFSIGLFLWKRPCRGIPSSHRTLTKICWTPIDWQAHSQFEFL